MQRLTVTTLFICFLGTASAAADSSRQAIASHVFINGVVYTVNPDQPWAQAVALVDDEIVHVGDNASAQAWIGQETRVTDLGGRMLMPAFQDSHVHMLTSGQNLLNCNLDEAANSDQVREKLVKCGNDPNLGDGDWLLGSLWWRSSFPGGKPPAGFLDELFPDRPVVIEAMDGHSRWINQRAVELAGITASTINPAGGNIGRDPVTGKANGMLDGAAMALITDLVPRASLQQDLVALRAAIALAHEFGITATIEPGITLRDATPFKLLSDQGELGLRVLLALSPAGFEVTSFGPEVYDTLDRMETVTGPDLKANSVKFYIDGVIENATAPLLAPYLEGGENNLEPYYSPEELSSYFTRLDAMGINIHVHAIGDLGVRLVLDGFEAMRTANGPSDNRHVITHLQLIDPQDRARFQKLNITASFSALWAYPDEYVTGIYPPLIGTERIQQSYPIATLANYGTRIAGASDWSVTSLDPLLAIETAITRQDPYSNQGPRLNATEAVDLATMLAAYTINTAWLMNNEHITGSIETGKKADLIVLDKNLFDVPPHEISDARVEMTLFEGNIVYQHTP